MRGRLAYRLACIKLRVFNDSMHTPAWFKRAQYRWRLRCYMIQLARGD
jgi:hypothetical protein